CNSLFAAPAISSCLPAASRRARREVGIKFACLLIALDLASKKPFLQFPKSNGWRILKRCLLGIKSRVSGFQLANYLFCTLKTAAAAIATCLFFLAFVRNSLSAKQWAQVISPRWKCQNKSIV